MYYHIFDVSSGRVLQVVMTPKCAFSIDDYRPLFSSDDHAEHYDIDVIESEKRITNGVVENGQLKELTNG
ncbi:hypothetical protein [Salinivibrio socompensis]|uniref:hypothetical protein n=1 Tax=Salinivibrio socompensis TaxID=1510206 RepID=UPI000472E98D|nr:hypothetical protein [Salinivibrio socompensis]